MDTGIISNQDLSFQFGIENSDPILFPSPDVSSDDSPGFLSSLISEITIFDSEFYLRNNLDLPFATNNTSSEPSADAYNHYVQFGAVEKRDPSPLFDSSYYLEQNPSVATALAGGDFRNDPLLHYIESGAQSGLDPNPFFDSDYYLEQNSDVAKEGVNPLEHYIQYGSTEGRAPSNQFDPDFYLNQHSDVAASGMEPLEHFLIFGQEEGRIPIAL